MPKTVKQILAEARYFSDEELYLLVKLPAAAITAAAGIIAEISDPFTALIVDKDEVTMVVPHEAVEEFAARLAGHEVSVKSYRLLTIDVVLEPDMVGFMAAISTALAAASVPIFPFAAYSRDHLLVPADQYDLALVTLEAMRVGA